jgi:hypothetical protein
MRSLNRRRPVEARWECGCPEREQLVNADVVDPGLPTAELGCYVIRRYFGHHKDIVETTRDENAHLW